MSSGAALVGLPEHYAHILESNDSSYSTTLPPSVTPSTSLRREPSFTQFPRIEEVEESQLTPVQERDQIFTEADLMSIGGKSSKSSKGDSSTSSTSVDDEAPTPPEPTGMALAKVSVVEETFPSFFDSFEWGDNFTAADAKLQLPAPVITTIPLPETPTDPPKSLTNRLRRKSWMPSSGRTTPRNASPERQAVAVEQEKALAALEGAAPLPVIGRSTPADKATKRRSSWMPSTKPAAPSPEPVKSIVSPPSNVPSSRPPSRRRLLGAVPPSSSVSAPVMQTPTSAAGQAVGGLPPLNTDVQQKRGRRLSGMFSGSSTPTTPKRSSEEPRSATSASLTKSFSTDKLPSMTTSFGSFDKLSTLANKASFDPSRLAKSSSTRKRDEAWGAFKALDADFSKFNGKSSAVKATIVRASLMPFMRVHHNMDMDKLRAEDLEKRITILDKWWRGLLDMLTQQNNQLLSSTDRPLVLDAICMLMERPEWRAPGSPLVPAVGRASSDRPKSSSSIDSNASSDFIAEAIYHNIRNIYVKNLVSQMEFAVDKMSAKTTPVSVVSFCGKTCAYFFFFVPRAARFLISLWKPTQESMRRILDECGVPRHSIMGGVSARIVAKFPAHLQDLRFTSMTATLRVLQKTALPPPGTANFDWNGPWINKWTGQESDLFYSFVKSYHALALDFLPVPTKKVERICAPGLLMVHAQLLANLDATIRRNEAAETARAGVSNITFDDVLADPDASVTAVILGPANINRLMSENRIIMLLRDCLSERTFKDQNVRQLLAHCLNDILQAGARKTSLFNHHACYTLCDFLEEAIAIFAKYENTCESGEKVFNWTFWFAVWRKMVQSQNTTTEIRLFSLLYSTWTHITEDEDRKTELCTNFLLSPDVFNTHFSHWCPMVRGYYMRLLSWRVARYDVNNSLPSDTAILAKLMERLSNVWGYFLYSKCGPGSPVPLDYLATPNPPAPGRRLLIIRTDPLVSVTGVASISLDDPAQPPNAGYRARRNSWMEKVGGGEWRPDSADSASSESSEPDDGASRRWSLLRNVVGVSSRSKSQSPKPDSRNGSGSGRSSPVKEETPRSLAAPARPRHHQRQRSGSMPAAPRHRTYCFKFSLEYVDRRFQTPASIVLSPPRLPNAAQEHLMGNYDITSMFNDIKPTKPTGNAAGMLNYTGRALAEWTTVVNECQNFFERRMREGVPSSKLVETPMLGVETFRRPG